MRTAATVTIWQPGDDEPAERRVLDSRGRTWKRNPDGSWTSGNGDDVSSWARLLEQSGAAIQYHDRPREYAKAIAELLRANVA